MQTTIRSCCLIAAMCLAVLSLPAAVLHAQEVNYPLAVTTGTKGEIYIADRNLPGIWKLTDGKLELFFKGSKKFRTLLNAPRCLAIDKDGKLLAGDSATRQVYRFSADGKPEPVIQDSTGVGIGIPMGIAVDSKGDIYVTDLETHRLYKVPGKGGEAEEIAQVGAPRGITIDGEDRLWIVSQEKIKPRQVVRISADGKKIEGIVIGRPFKFPHSVIVDKKNVAYVVDGYSKAVWRVKPGEKPAKWVSGGPFKNPTDLAWDGEDVLVIDPHAKSLFRIDPEGKVEVIVLKVAN